MKISDIIEQFLLDMIQDSQGEVEIKRNELAGHFNCVPSQINYVISTRFTAENGYIVESRRGGGGSIKIRRIPMTPGNYMMHVINSVGDRMNQLTVQIFIKNFYENGHITLREAELMLAALSDNSLPIPQPGKDRLRATIFKNMLTKLS